ncbi:hypothetical protein BCR37DRAFT_378684 [Protomyces lactucae-debilis]|uniref:Uncharacterized protein n=1 Tax=Protomyces lactucae-debilis TaxID=2754530 RepID=A0A1Y2FID1_PROLT|nr:uncharacterized protein BCR37DRAFT_378684 [Protomyces lactucae-debilis]ORY83712.1 hypothetical protein BCR37DRAFT_378684 [Protomyces lactucae-debilis]
MATLERVFIAAVLAPAIGLGFFPKLTCDGFGVPNATGATLHFSRLMGVRGIIFGLAIIFAPRNSAERQMAIKMAALSEALDVVVGAISYMQGDMAGGPALQSAVAAGIVALLGYFSL